MMIVIIDLIYNTLSIFEQISKCTSTRQITSENDRITQEHINKIVKIEFEPIRSTVFARAS